ncbi:MAG: hypothetical protein QOH88_491 [Verrucomicrobiota bacterium]|jgi:hypothetical protein
MPIPPEIAMDKVGHPRKGHRRTGVARRDDVEAAILVNLAPGAYTPVVAGRNGQTGVALVKVFALH